MTEEIITGEDKKFYCERCKTGFPANVLFQSMGKKFWRICEECSAVWRKDYPASEPVKLDVLVINI